jgi:hypothetical protein
VGCSGDTFSVILSGSVSLQFTIIREEPDELEDDTYAIPENSFVYPEMLHELHDPTTLFDTMIHLTFPIL